MKSNVQEVYEKAMIGGSGSLRPAKGQALVDFQSDVQSARDLATEGKIQIVIEHKESETGNRFVDAVAFKRLS